MQSSRARVGRRGALILKTDLILTAARGDILIYNHVRRLLNETIFYSVKKQSSTRSSILILLLLILDVMILECQVESLVSLPLRLLIYDQLMTGLLFRRVHDLMAWT